MRIDAVSPDVEETGEWRLTEEERLERIAAIAASKAVGHRKSVGFWLGVTVAGITIAGAAIAGLSAIYPTRNEANDDHNEIKQLIQSESKINAVQQKQLEQQKELFEKGSLETTKRLDTMQGDIRALGGRWGVEMSKDNDDGG